MKNHITLGIYANGDYVHNIVRDEDLASHIRYNETMRPGRVLYVDGKRVYDGCKTAEALKTYDEIARKFWEQHTVFLSHAAPTIPYR